MGLMLRLGSGSQPRQLCSPSRCLAVSGIIFGCHNRVRGASGIWWAEAMDIAQHPVLHRQPQQQEVLAPNCL